MSTGRTNRRRFLKIAGASGVILAASGTGYMLTRGPTRALRPWEQAGAERYPDPMRAALSYAILAPSPYNRQPWLVQLHGPHDALLYCDLDRLLPYTDPFNRQTVIALGCFLELFSLAAAEAGFAAQITLFPEGDPGNGLDKRPIAGLHLAPQPDIPKDPLFAHCRARRTTREPFDMGRAVPAEPLARMARAARATTSVRFGATRDQAEAEQLRQLARDGVHQEFASRTVRQETADFMRIGRREIEQSPDGIAVSNPVVELLQQFDLIDRENMAARKSRAFALGFERMEQLTLASPGFFWIATADNDRGSQIAAGRAYLRASLQATADGLAMQPLSQALREYPGMRKLYVKLHRLLMEQPGERIQMLARIGYADRVPPAPRWPLEHRLRATGVS
ncbi:MAG TPA: twin-arginine translocation pathway signal protein [Alphaproteobacteria bacterium]|nr:twin-arginine translocation pathway signal protein [Alphaproteobacteria bacterium]